MKTVLSWKLITLVIIFSLLFVKCGNDDNPAEPNYDSALVGTWKVNKISWDGQTDKGSYDQSKLDSLGTIWDLILRSDKTTEQTTNYCCALSTSTGTWSATEYELTLNLKAANSNEVEVKVYQFVIDGGKLILDWRSTAGTIYYVEFVK